MDNLLCQENRWTFFQITPLLPILLYHIYFTLVLYLSLVQFLSFLFCIFRLFTFFSIVQFLSFLFCFFNIVSLNKSTKNWKLPNKRRINVLKPWGRRCGGLFETMSLYFLGTIVMKMISNMRRKTRNHIREGGCSSDCITSYICLSHKYKVIWKM